MIYQTVIKAVAKNVKSFNALVLGRVWRPRPRFRTFAG